eukprot:Plantae.Rhodophyta-Hildenbrandia_rubra.ctg18719.p1 GENE.Plantae.Rhodophyta-Hildenbrandia_rubra.ctg18719~~Plantae.Rhodophyta-Hildenbrandia_rubra.ctg18719.p1  ORF type:complete len:236 (+),score=33.64 Plantae.Rhodophyta-Hildenbrandia_rubra.ctg18719:154-861(+)
MVVPIGVLVGQAGTAFKTLGGSSILFKLIQSYLFGTTLRTVEYPDGELHTIKFFRPTLARVRTLIAQAQPPIFPTAFLSSEDVKQLAVFHSPHFTERILTDSDVRSISNSSWVFWSKYSYEEDPIPLKGVKLDGSHVEKQRAKKKEESLVSDRELQDRAIALTRTILGKRRNGFSISHHDRLIDLASDGDVGLLALARNFGSDQREFQRHALRLLHRRQPGSESLSARTEQPSAA